MMDESLIVDEITEKLKEFKSVNKVKKLEDIFFLANEQDSELEKGNIWVVKRAEKHLRGSRKMLSSTFEDIKNLILGG